MDPPSPDAELPPEFAEFLRTIFGEQAEEMLQGMRQAGFDPNQLLAQAGLPANPATMGMILDQVKRMLSGGGSGEVINWELAYNTARQVSAGSGPDPSIHPSQTGAVDKAIRLADLWLDQVVEFPAAGGQIQALSSATWIEATWPHWRDITAPVATSVIETVTELLTQQGLAHPSQAEQLDQASPMFQQVTGSLFAVQIGQAVGTISRDVFGLTDTGLALGPGRTMALLPTRVEAFAADLDLPPNDVRLFLATREAAHARLFAAVPWLADHMFGAVEAYASGISIDIELMERALESLDLSDQSSIGQALASGVFAPSVTQSQRVALDRLETALALVEGWVDVVSAKACDSVLAPLGPLREMIRRRRAVGGPAEKTFTTLLGLEMRPRRAREATRLWADVTKRLGSAARDEIWAHPDFLPTAEDLTAPDTFVERREAQQAADAAVDAELEALLQELGQGPGAEGDPSDGGAGEDSNP
ncbi:MAG: zinc-dependent metalloprotease [Micrococcales bacterium]|nr:zinc-dependent metalloprotease [Micrococcales bacterium]